MPAPLPIYCVQSNKTAGLPFGPPVRELRFPPARILEVERAVDDRRRPVCQPGVPGGTVGQCCEAERQSTTNAYHSAVAEFWQDYDYLESIYDEPLVNHNKNSDVIAINLNEFAERAAEHRQKLSDVTTLKDLLKESRSHKFLDYKAVDSAVRSAQSAKNPMITRCATVKC